MKSLLVLLLLTITYSGSVFAQIDTAETQNIEVIQELQAQNCSSSNDGWWLKLDVTVASSLEQGGVSTSSGEYWGCGTCGDCRVKLNAKVDNILEVQKKSCAQKGGEVKSVDRGQWKESVQPNTWTLYANNIRITCEKWIPCDR